MTQYHVKGIRGANVSVGIIDTGAEVASLPMAMRTPKHGLAVSAILTGMDGHFEGIAPEATIKVIDLQKSKNIPISSVLRAVEDAIAENVDILSISLGTSDSWAPMQAAIDKALAKNILVFAAAGNSGDRGYEYPSSCNGAISVASINQARQLSPFNTRNDATVVFAPGEELSLPIGNGELAEFSGTSFATPFAAGLAALILSARRNEDPRAAIKRRDMIDLLRNDDHLGLNCTTHSYVMEPTCTEILSSHRSENKSKSQYFSIALLFLLGLLAYYMSHL